jgi:signal transduction histidine kinase
MITAENRSRSSRSQSMRGRLLVLLGGMLLVTLLVIGTSVFYFISQNEQDAWQGRQGEAARHAAEIVAAFIQRTQVALTLVGLLERGTLVAEPRVMNDLLQQSPVLLEMIRLDANGKVFASANQDAPLLANLFTIPLSRWFIESKAGRLYLGNVQISSTSEPYLILSIPASDGGVVAARLHMNVLWDVVADLHFGETGQAYVVNQEGKMIAHTDPAVALTNTSLAGRPERAALLQAPNQEWRGSYTNFEGTKVVGVTSPVMGTDWVVITEMAESEAFAVSQTALLLLGGGMMLFGLLVVLVTGRFLGQLILQPMETLRAGAERIGQGDLSHRIHIPRQDEAGQVAEAFNEMAGRLRERDEQLAAKTSALAVELAERRRADDALRELNEELELRVAERTAELVQANEQLQREITERVQAETALQTYAKKLERSNRELQDFAYIASHDMQEPLRKVQAFSDRLQAKYGQTLDDRGRDYLERMQRAAGRMQTLITDLLTYSRVTTKARPFVPVDLARIVHEVLSDLEKRIEQVGGRVEVGDLLTIDADPPQMGQLLQNLIGNALKFHRQDLAPVVRIHAQLLNSQAPQPAGDTASDGFCQITVQDNGIGFDEKYLDRIFQVFQRLHGRGTYEGTGTGLAICRKIVERHDGSITAESKPGEGATFIVTLPVRQPKGETGQ